MEEDPHPEAKEIWPHRLCLAPGCDAHGGFKKTTELLTDNGGATLSINLFNERV